MARKRYSDKFRANAVLMLEAAGYEPGKNGGALMRVAKALKMPHNTLRNWYVAAHNPVPSDVRREKRGELVTLIRDEIYNAIEAAQDQDKKFEASYRDLITGAAILVDKLQLLEGKATERTEIIDRTSPREAIFDELTRIATRSDAGQNPEPVH